MPQNPVREKQAITSNDKYGNKATHIMEILEEFYQELYDDKNAPQVSHKQKLIQYNT